MDARQIISHIKSELRKLQAQVDERFSIQIDQLWVELNRLTLAEQEQAKNLDEIVVNFRQGIKAFAESNAALAQIYNFDELTYEALIAAAMIKPVNNEDPILLQELADIEAKDRFFSSDGYFFEINSLAEYIKKRGLMNNVATSQLFSARDQAELIDAAKKTGIDLTNLNPADYKVEDHPAIEEGARRRIADNDRAANRAAHGGNSNHAFFAAPADFVIRELAEASGKSTDSLIAFHAAHAFQFYKAVSVSPYIRARLMSFEQACALSNSQISSLDYATHGLTGTPDELRLLLEVLDPPLPAHRPQRR